MVLLEELLLLVPNNVDLFGIIFDDNGVAVVFVVVFEGFLLLFTFEFPIDKLKKKKQPKNTKSTHKHKIKQKTKKGINKNTKF